MVGEREKRNTNKIRKITGLGVLTALVIVLQLLAPILHSVFPLLPFAFNLVNIPICVGAILYGASGGMWLGLVFGIIVLVSGDAAAFMTVSIVGTVVTVLVKGMAAGAVAGGLYRLFSHRNKTLASVISAISCPIVNTCVFLLGCLAFFMDTLQGWARVANCENVFVYIFGVLVGVNFLFELATSAVLTPVLIRIIGLIRKNS